MKSVVRAFVFTLALAGSIFVNSVGAKAAVFDFFFTDGGTTHGSGQFFSSGAASPFLITSATGSVTYLGITQEITGIDPVPGYASNDNLIIVPGFPAFSSFGGLSFITAVDVYNFGFINPIYGITQQSTNPGGTLGGLYVPLTEFTISAAVPEPSTWAMMILGLLGVGFVAYRRRNQSAPLRAA